ncbi:hypothetical protein AAG570_000845 [Ranatra chinensis]|uniref:Uncharacterized protein n=1 Tax=Ranatra chinensis TaxID=642074 RepID=A0ABD0ZAX4_9HEMI
MASKRRNMFHKNKTQETTEKGGTDKNVINRTGRGRLSNELVARDSSSSTSRMDLRELSAKLWLGLDVKDAKIEIFTPEKYVKLVMKIKVTLTLWLARVVTPVLLWATSRLEVSPMGGSFHHVDKRVREREQQAGDDKSRQEHCPNQLRELIGQEFRCARRCLEVSRDLRRGQGASDRPGTVTTSASVMVDTERAALVSGHNMYTEEAAPRDPEDPPTAQSEPHSKLKEENILDQFHEDALRQVSHLPEMSTTKMK